MSQDNKPLIKVAEDNSFDEELPPVQDPVALPD